jgi:hypothetical protein
MIYVIENHHFFAMQRLPQNSLIFQVGLNINMVVLSVEVDFVLQGLITVATEQDVSQQKGNLRT